MFRQRWRSVAALVILLSLAWSGARLWDGRKQAAVLQSDPEDILSQPALRQVALKLGEPVYQTHCASCHGASGKGDSSQGVPDMTTGEHLYGQGRVAEIEFIARHGIRSADKRGWNLASMPAYASLHPYKNEPLPSLTPGQIEGLTQYLLAFAGRATNPDAAAEGGKLFHAAAGCYDCHGLNAEGDSSIGAPALADHHWIYGAGSHDDIYRTLVAGRAGLSPAFDKVLGAVELRVVAVYAASLQTTTQQADAR